MKPQSLPSSKDNGAASFPIHEFQMTAVIDPAEHPAVSGDSAIPSVRNTSPVVAFTPPSLSFVDVPSNGAATIAVCSVSPIRARPIVQHREFFPLHFLNANELYRAIQSREEQELTFLRRRKKNASAIASLAERRNKWLVDTFREYPDILFHVNKDGTIVFWGIQVGTERMLCHFF